MFMQTNRTTARIFPAVLDVENPEFKRKLDRMVEINEKLLAVGETEDASFVKNLKRIPLIAALASELLAAYLMPPIESGSLDFAEFEPQVVYWVFMNSITSMPSSVPVILLKVHSHDFSVRKWLLWRVHCICCNDRTTCFSTSHPRLSMLEHSQQWRHIAILLKFSSTNTKIMLQQWRQK